MGRPRFRLGAEPVTQNEARRCLCVVYQLIECLASFVVGEFDEVWRLIAKLCLRKGFCVEKNQLAVRFMNVERALLVSAANVSSLQHASDVGGT